MTKRSGTKQQGQGPTLPKGVGSMTLGVERIPASEAKAQPEPEKKSGVEIVREKGWQRHADLAPEARVQVIDHDHKGGPKILWSGTPEEFKALGRALGKALDRGEG